MNSSLVNGEVFGHVPVDDRGLAYGDGVFETIGVKAGRPRFWQGHMDRMRRGCQRLELPMPAQEVLLRELKTVAAGQQHCLVKIILTRGSGGRGYAPADQATAPCRIVSSHDFPAGVKAIQRSGVHGRFCEQRLALQPALGGVKHLNRLEQVLAAQEMKAHADQVGILRNTEGFVISAISANFFLLLGDTLLTPRMDRCGVRGVLRNLVLRDYKARSELRRVTVDMLEDASEVFLCSAIRGIIPLLSLGDVRWEAGPVTRELQSWYQERLLSA